MEMTGEYKIPAPRQKVWEALNDPEILKACISGCQELNKESDTELSATVKSKVGPVSATFKGKVTLSDIDAPNGYKISGEGTGGVAGFAKGGAEVSLVDDGDGTLLNYTATGQVGGKLAQIGSRLIDSTAKKMANEFFGKFAEVVAADNAAPEASAEAEAPAAPAPEAAPAATPAAPEAPAAATAQSGGGISPVVWVGGLIVAVVVVLALLV
jgi:carbon monoxide dehydrogenase subunit G